ncbi:modifier of mdg4-like isoform X8 [Anopheles funestus]|uniref:modifier of mdg4-like isoform X8 n=1 Tax=Anopheles funestus TaxID=62324 RepID=UPI0020C703F6|nr:modifier of mdg4-like isoform X8 [Anopheles funestus]
MADDEQFSLCWNNFNSNLSAGFHESLQRGDLVDVTLAAEGQLVQAHRLVLSVCSPYFRKMFNQMPKNQHAFVFLKDVTHAALQDLIQFMYCGEVNVKQDALPAFISTAEALQIKGLTETGDSAPPQQSPAKEEVSAVPATTASISTTVPAASQRIKSQRNRVQSYKIESEESGDDKIVHIQASTSHHVSAQQLQAQTNISSQKRTMSQRGVTSHAMKRPKISISASSDGMDTSDNTHTPAQAQTVQTVQIVKQIPAQVIEPEYIELPMESINPKAEPDYTDETAEIETVDAETEQEHKLSEHDQGDGDDDGHYVEDETYGDMAMGKYEESYLTEGEDGAKPGASGFVDSYTSDGGTGTEQSTQGLLLEVQRLKKRLAVIRAEHKSPQTATIEEIRIIHQKLRTIDEKYYQQICVNPAKPLKISGFPMPLQCEEDVERLELMVNRNSKLRKQYVEYLRCKKAFSVDISDCFGKFFTGEAMTGFNWKITRSSKKPRKSMEHYQIFTSCMLEAWREHGFDEVKLDSELRHVMTILNKRYYVTKYQNRDH